MLTEINIDGLIGPTHHYGGLGVGNLASLAHRDRISNPRQAALEGLAKAKLVGDLGIPQFIWLPPSRPNRELLQSLGFSGQLDEQIATAYQTAPWLLSAAFSGAFMWTANSATVTPAVDARDGRYHFTPANLISSLHRASEANDRKADIAKTFSIYDRHVLHDPLPGVTQLRDEGAANHMRLSDPTGEIGFNVFVYGEVDSKATDTRDSKIGDQFVGTDSIFMARQTRMASEAIARRHQLDPATTFFLRQHPMAIAAGVFHNDVIATSHEGLFIHHEFAFIDAEEELARLESTFAARVGRPLTRIVVLNEEMSLSDSVQSYFFNSQLLSPPSPPSSTSRPRMVFVCPDQCREIAASDRLLRRLLSDTSNPIDEVKFVVVGQSMAGGGGPACLRLRVPADHQTLSQLPSYGRMNQRLYDDLSAVIEAHYPQQVSLASFCDDRFLEHLKFIERALFEQCVESTGGAG